MFFPNYLFKKYSKNTQKIKGLILVESIIAISVITISLLSIFTLLSSSLSINSRIQNEYVASYLSLEGLEIIKNITMSSTLKGLPITNGLKDGDYEVDYLSSSIHPNSSRYLNFKEDNNSYSYEEGDPSIFKRKITINITNSGAIHTLSEVSWLDKGSENKSITLENYSYPWR